ncbi:MAG: helix-turn-helix domain-containing protein [Candidatus Nanohaloarchaea archaeon]
MDTRKLVERSIEENPGIRFTGLKEETGLANGTLQYHICQSDRIARKKGSLMPPEKCESCELRHHCQEKCLLGVMREEVKRNIVRMLDEGFSQEEIAEELEKDPSTISYHVHRLEELGALQDAEPVEELPY